MTQSTIDPALRHSVQILPDVKQEGLGAAGDFWENRIQRGPLLPAWGTRWRERVLRLYYRHDYSTLLQGAFMGLVKKVKATPWEIKGGRNTTNTWQRLFREAQFGLGWGQFLSLVILDYLRFDGGAYVEVIAPGNPMKAPTGRVVGLAHLDSYHCLPTGDPNYPVIYYDRKGVLHTLHHTRVLHFVDMPDGDQDHPGYGLCALSRAIAIVERQILMNRYVVAKLDDKPPPGMLLVGGMTKAQWDAAWLRYREQQAMDDRPEWGKVIPIFGADASLTPKVESVAFSQAPEKFDYQVYVELDIHELALAIGVDIQELWELTTGGLGSAGQSEIQHAKSQGRAYGDILTMTERSWNDVLPESLEFAYKVRDPYEAQEQATTAQVWAGFTASAGASLTADEKRQILANQVEAVADAILDDEGELIRLNDADPQPEMQITAVDSTPNESGAAGTPTTAQLTLKAFEDTRAAFVRDFTDLVQAANQDELARRRAGTVMRGQLTRLGRQAFDDGLKQGGVEDGLDDADRATFAVWLAEQSGYVTAFLDEVYSAGLTDAQIGARAETWANKSLQQPYYDGLASADKNGLYEFFGDDGVENCETCRSLKGTKMRMGEWVAKRLRPGVDTASFDCGGWQCQHGLRRVKASKAHGWKFDPNQPRDDIGRWTDTGNVASRQYPEGRLTPPPGFNQRYYESQVAGLSAEGYHDFWGKPPGHAERLFETGTPTPTQEELDALYAYSYQHDQAINSALRKGLPVPLDEQANVEGLDSLLSKSRVPANLKSYRGLSSDNPQLSVLREQIEQGDLRVGSILQDDGFSSTSLNPNVAGEFSNRGKRKQGALFTIQVPEGAQGVYRNTAFDLAGESSRFTREQELILPRGQRYRVDDIFENGNEYRLRLTVLSESAVQKSRKGFMPNTTKNTPVSEDEQDTGEDRSQRFQFATWRIINDSSEEAPKPQVGAEPKTGKDRS